MRGYRRRCNIWISDNEEFITAKGAKGTKPGWFFPFPGGEVTKWYSRHGHSGMGIWLFPAEADGEKFRPAGTYLLHIELAQPSQVAFGKFQQGKVFDLPAGSYIYIGSALGQRGAMTLPRRLMRHASRSEGGPPHPIRAELAQAFAAVGLAWLAQPPQRAKRLYWHVDYLLDLLAANLTDLVVIGDGVRRESEWAQWLAAQPAVHLIAPGIGARDLPGETHLWRLPEADWWQTMVVPYCTTLPR